MLGQKQKWPKHGITQMRAFLLSRAWAISVFPTTWANTCWTWTFVPSPCLSSATSPAMSLPPLSMNPLTAVLFFLSSNCAFMYDFPGWAMDGGEDIMGTLFNSEYPYFCQLTISANSSSPSAHHSCHPTIAPTHHISSLTPFTCTLSISVLFPAHYPCQLIMHASSSL